MIGTHSFEIKFTLQDYPMIETPVIFDVIFDDPCELNGYVSIDKFEQNQELTFRYSGSNEVFDSSKLFSVQPAFC